MKKSVLLILISALAFLGCAEEKAANNNSYPAPPYVNVPPGPYTPPGPGPGDSPGDDGNWVYGGTADLEIDGGTYANQVQLLSEYAQAVRYQPTDIRVNVNFQKIGDNWGGTLTISYTDWDGYHEGYFTTGGSQDEVVFNVWYADNGQPVFHAVLEDFLGGLVIVIDDYTYLGDGEGDITVGGSIWFKNFEFTYAPHPPTRCWFVGLRNNNPTPYDCRPWPRDHDDPFKRNDTYASVNPEPASGYKRLGRFSGLNVQEAFNGDFTLDNF